MKNLIICLASFVVISLVAACSSDTDKQASTTQSAPMQTDTKDMHPAHK
jgi:uncharacterized protein YcfL